VEWGCFWMQKAAGIPPYHASNHKANRVSKEGLYAMPAVAKAPRSLLLFSSSFWLNPYKYPAVVERSNEAMDNIQASYVCACQ
jgi:hypothetical protein